MLQKRAFGIDGLRRILVTDLHRYTAEGDIVRTMLHFGQTTSIIPCLHRYVFLLVFEETFKNVDFLTEVMRKKIRDFGLRGNFRSLV